MEKERLEEIIKNHRMWLDGSSEGVRADLTGADLMGVSLAGVNLADANLTDANLAVANLTDASLAVANLTGASLTGARLTGAFLADANLAGASLRYAELTDARLTGAFLAGADLTGADLTGADLTGAKLTAYQIPQKGELIVWKKAGGHIVKLRVPPEAKRTACIINRKCRAEFVEVLCIEGAEEVETRNGCKYRVGETVYPDSYDDDPRIDCANGIHFFLTREEAEGW